MAHLPVPRLLPATIAALAALLAFKSVAMVRAALPVQAQSAVVASARAATPTPPRPAHARPSPPAPCDQVRPTPVSEAERKVLQELRRRRRQLDTRETALNARESVLAAADKKLDARVKELLALQKRLETLEAERKQREELGWQGLVKVYEVMKPRDAATIFNDLQLSVLLPVLDRMKDRNAAPILAAMNPDKARTVTAALARLRTGRNTPPGTPGG